MKMFFCCVLFSIILTSPCTAQTYSDAVKYAESEKNVERIDKKPEYIVIYYNTSAELFIKQLNFEYNDILKDNAVSTEVNIYNTNTARDKAIQSSLARGFKKSSSSVNTYYSSDGRITLILKEPSAETNYKPFTITSYASFFHKLD